METKSQAVNYRLIAQQCGVSKTTVGRVLQGTGYVSEEKRALILKAADELGYKPDPLLGALSRRRWPKGAKLKTATLAWVYKASKPGAMLNLPEFKGLKDRAGELGYAVDSFNVADYPSEASVSRVIQARGIRGVVIQAFRENEGFELPLEQFYSVFLGPENDMVHVHNVQPDFCLAIKIGVRACVEKGYKKIGIALMNYRAGGTNRPFRAYAMLAQEELTKRFGKQPSIFSYEVAKSYSTEFLDWVEGEGVEAVVATNVQPYYWLKDRATMARVPLVDPRKMPPVGFLCLWNVQEVGRVACVNHRPQEMGRQAADLVHQQLQHGEVGIPAIPLRLLIPPVYIAGESLPDHPALQKP